jgi:hypothetical protein
MAKATAYDPEPITLHLSQQEAEDLRGLIASHVAGAAEALWRVSSALGDVGVSPTRFVATPRHMYDDDPVIVIIRREGE